jgi:hypothetical protein
MIGRTDDTSGANVTISLAHMHVHEGRMYEVSYKTTDGSPLADNATIDFLFRPNASRSHFSFGPIAANPVEVIFYEAPTITNVGTSLSVVGLNRIRSLPPSSVVYRSPTVTAAGDQLQIDLQVWGLTPLVPAFSEVLWILRQNTDYLIRMINRAGSAQDIGVILQWYEEE